MEDLISLLQASGDAVFHVIVALRSGGQEMTNEHLASDHWRTGEVYSRMIATLKAAGINFESVTVEQLAPVDHFRAREFTATVELADALPIVAGQRLVDIGRGIDAAHVYSATSQHFFESRII